MQYKYILKYNNGNETQKNYLDMSIKPKSPHKFSSIKCPLTLKKN